MSERLPVRTSLDSFIRAVQDSDISEVVYFLNQYYLQCAPHVNHICSTPSDTIFFPLHQLYYCLRGSFPDIKTHPIDGPNFLVISHSKLMYFISAIKYDPSNIDNKKTILLDASIIPADARASMYVIALYVSLEPYAIQDSRVTMLSPSFIMDKTNEKIRAVSFPLPSQSSLQT